MPPHATRDDITRRFWAMFLDSEVGKDGQVKGFQDWQRTASEEERRQADRYCHFAWVKIERDHRDPDECIASGVGALKEHLAMLAPAVDRRSTPEYARFRFELLKRILAEHLKPIDVAKILEDAADRFREIAYDECRRYREMNDVWQPVSGPRLSEDRCEQIRRGRRGVRQIGTSEPLRLTQEQVNMALEQAAALRVMFPAEDEPPPGEV